MNTLLLKCLISVAFVCGASGLCLRVGFRRGLHSAHNHVFHPTEKTALSALQRYHQNPKYTESPPNNTRYRFIRWRWIPAALLAGCTIFGRMPSALASSLPQPAAPSASLPMPIPIPLKSQFHLVFRLFFAVLAGASVGWERASTKHSVGIRTLALVSLGAAAFTICSVFGFVGARADMSRIAAGVPSGVGFIGAGVITTSREAPPNGNVHGLTTAAAIWLSAAVGVLSGAGLFVLSGAVALITIGVLRLDSLTKTSQLPRDMTRKQPMDKQLTKLDSKPFALPKGTRELLASIETRSPNKKRSKTADGLQPALSQSNIQIPDLPEVVMEELNYQGRNAFLMDEASEEEMVSELRRARGSLGTNKLMATATPERLSAPSPVNGTTVSAFQYQNNSFGFRDQRVVSP